MADPNRTKEWASGDVLTADDLNAEFDNLLDSLGIVNADISASAAIAASKLDTTVMETNTAQTVSGVKTFSAEPVFSVGVKIADDQDVLFASGAKMERDDGHILLTPESNKLVKISVLRQDDTTNSYKNASIILTGWGYKQGAAATAMTEAVTFGITFDDRPVVVANGIGYLTGVPSHIGNFTGSIVEHCHPYAMATTGFTVQFSRVSHTGDAPGNFGTTYYYGYSWIAVGELA